MDLNDDGKGRWAHPCQLDVSGARRTLRALEKVEGRNHKPNRSILFGFGEDYNIQLEEGKQVESDYFVIITSNGYVESTVPDSVAFESGGKSDAPKTSTAANSAAAAKADALALAALAEALSLEAAALLAAEADALALEEATCEEELPPHTVSTNARDSVMANAAIFPMVSCCSLPSSLFLA